MSGIAALYNPNGKPVDESLINKMTSLMTRRGPKKQQFWLEKNIALAHCLLPTTHQSHDENQPTSLNNRAWISADARIDARQELINKLSPHHPQVSSTTTDDKLILYAYLVWGVKCLDHLIGDFSFVLWDSIKQCLFCATDQFGVSPLYYSETNEGICISNTLNVIRIHPEVSSELNELVIADYLLFRVNENSETTIYKKIHHLPASHYLLVEGGQLTTKQYWQLNTKKRLDYVNQEDYVEEFQSLLTQAVRDRTRTESIATHLSGGMDSSSINAICYDLLNTEPVLSKIKAYTYASSGSLPDLEGPLAAKVAKSFGIEHTIVSNQSPLKTELSPTELSFPEPRFLSRDTSNYAMLECAASHSSVLLTGFGGDPLLMRAPLNSSHAWPPLNFLSTATQAIQQWQHTGERPNLGIKKILKRGNGVNRSRSVPKWIAPAFSSRVKLEDHIDQVNSNKALNHRLGMNTGALWRRIFCWNDPGFTHIPIKVCHPFFDVRLLEFVESLPLFSLSHDKMILRQSMLGKLPHRIINRPKTPLPGNGLQSVLINLGEAPREFDTLLKNKLLSHYVDSNYFLDGLNTLEGCKKSYFKFIMRVLSLAHWFEEYEQWQKGSFKSVGLNDNVKRIHAK